MTTGAPDGVMSNPAHRSVFSVCDLPEPKRFEVWKESISCIFDVDADTETRREDFFAAVDATMIGPMMLARTTSRGQRWERSSSTIARDGMDHVMVQLYEDGDQTVTTSGRDVEQPKGGMLVYDLSRTIRARSDNFTNLSLIVPREAVAERVAAPDDLHMTRLELADPMVAMLRDHLGSVKRLAPGMGPDQLSAVMEATLALTAGCLNGVGRGTADLPRADRVTVALLAARRLIESNLSEEALGPDWVAHRLGMSRAALYRLFAPLGGVGHYVRERRLRRAMLNLRSDRRRTIYEIALNSGFASETTFGRAFRRRYGITPRDVRGQHREARSRMPSQGPDRRYEDWLLHLAV